MHLHLSKSSFSQIFQWSHAAHSRPFQSCFQTRFVFEPKAMQSYDHFLNCANFQAFFWKLFSAVGSVGASARVVFPFAVAKVLLFAELTKYFTGKIQTNFHRFSHTAGAQPLTPKTFSHAKTAQKKQCASRPTTHTLYYIENEFLIKISDSIKLHFFSAKKIRKATFVAYFNFDSFLIHFKFCHIRRFT